LAVPHARAPWNRLFFLLPAVLTASMILVYISRLRDIEDNSKEYLCGRMNHRVTGEQ
jgi:hypothetical protein